MKQSSYYTTVLAMGVVGMTVLGLQGCATGQQEASENEQASSASETQQVSFPDPEDAWVEKGTYVNMENLSKMREGLSKDQVRDLLGSPHFSEGLIGVHEWNYVFHVPRGDGTYRACQYQVDFDDDMLAEALHWREDACATLPEPEAPPEPRHITLEADALFDFDSSELSHEGRREVVSLTKRIREAFSSPDIVVTGYTDRIGRESYNLELSKKRAESVRQALIDQGVSPEAVRSMGRGESSPVVECPASSLTPQVKSCLGPNRRVEVDVRERSTSRSAGSAG